MRRIVCIVLLFVGGLMPAQVPAVWNYVDPGGFFSGLTLDDSGTRVITWGTRYDSCYYHGTAMFVLDTAGVLELDTSYEFAYCTDESPIRFVSKGDGSGYYMITTNDNNTPFDSCFVHFIDSSFALQWQQYVGRGVGSRIVSYNGRNYVSVEEGSNWNVFRFYQPGIVDTFNQVTHPYFNGTPQRMFAVNGSIYEIGSKNDLDSAFLCMVYDTLGNFQSSFSFDANANAGETPQYVVIHNNRILHINASGGSIYPANSDLSGNVNWIDTLNYQFRGASLDIVNDVAYVFCNSTSGYRLFSYDFNTGSLIDSSNIDSVWVFVGIKSGPAGGTVLFYRQAYTGALLIDQYDVQCNRIWRGYISHPSCTLGSSALDFIFDSPGNIYTLTLHSCSGAQTLISKFAPSLVSVPENNPEQNFQLFPNPATNEVRIQLNGQNENNSVNVLNSLGEVVMQKSFTGNSATLDITGIPSGLYFVEVISGSDQQSTQKLIVQHP